MLLNKLTLFVISTALLSCAQVSIQKKKKGSLKNDYIVRKVVPKILETSIFPGEVRKLVFQFPGDNKSQILFCNDRKYPSYFEKGIRVAYYAESYFSKRKKIICLIGPKLHLSKKAAQLKIEYKKYPEEKLNVDKKRVALSKKDLKRVLREQKVLNKRYNSSKEIPLFEDSFKHPIASFVTSIYGSKRIFNNHKHSQHLGTDYRAKVGVAIMASNSGEIVISRDLFYTGNTIIIDHGLNIFTVYGHLSKLNFKEGDVIKKGEYLGLSGATGRVTGPHLHWGVKINYNYIEGDSLVKTSTKN